MEQTYLTQEDLAARWRVSPHTIASWRARNSGPKYLKIGGRPRYRLTDIEEYEEARYTTPRRTESPPRETDHD